LRRLFFVIGVAWGAAASSAAPEAALPAASKQKIDFARDVQPIFEASCLNCHARNKYKGGLSLETRAALLKGGEDGPVAVVNDSAHSDLILRIASGDPDKVMPAKGDRLTTKQVAILRAWIDQGMAWPEDIGFGFRRAPLAPRKVTLSEIKGLDNPIDRLLAGYFAQHGGKPQALVDDRLFARRVHLDLVGLLPPPERLDAFLADTDGAKRTKLVESLLADRRAYADHWMTFWNDALRNAYRGTGFIDGGRQPITNWLYKSLFDNKPYDQFVRELISPVPGSEGFAKGIVWRGVVNASQVPPVQAAQNISQVFLGTNLKCASCHDSFVNYWKLADAYALAGVFADAPLEIHRCDKPTGKTSAIGFIYPELGAIDAAAPKAERMKQLAAIVTKPENGRLSRTIVNRLWAQLMGRGIVETVDDMDQLPWSADLLDWLAADFAEHGCDLKRTIGLICTSRAYRLVSVGAPKPGEKQFAFAGPIVKRMSAEQFVDAVWAVTGAWQSVKPELIKPEGRVAGGAAGQPAAKLDAKWVWSHDKALSADPGGRILLRKVVTLTEKPERAKAVLTCDNELVLYVNGTKVAASDNWEKPLTVDLTPLLQVGDNVFAVEATNWPDAENNKGTQYKEANPAAFVFYAAGYKGGQQQWFVGSDASWLWAKKADEAWKKQPFDTAGWQHSAELADAAAAYPGANLAAAWGAAPAAAQQFGDVRSSLTNDDPLTRALGRPNREQPVTRRESITTTLQALELTNGATLDQLLKLGASDWMSRHGSDPSKLVDLLYQKALGRLPTPPELDAALSLVGQPATAQGVEDLLWAITMLPEFQLVY
jgi:mono/diheme cytochrome c family protein